MAGNKKNLAAGIKEMRSVAARLLAWADDLEKSGESTAVESDSAAGDESSAASAVPAVAAPEPPTRAEVKAYLTSLCAAGYSGQVKALIASFGVTSLSGVPDASLADLMEQAALLGADGDNAGAEGSGLNGEVAHAG